MRAFIKKGLRTASLVAARILPSHTHQRIRRAAFAALREYKNSGDSVFETMRKEVPSPFKAVPASAVLEDTSEYDQRIMSAQHERPQEGQRGQTRTNPKSASQEVVHDSKKGILPSALETGRNAIAEPVGGFIGCGNRKVSKKSGLLRRLDQVDESCDIVLCCAFKGRHKILKQSIEESLSGPDGKSIRWMLVGSTPDDLLFISAMSKITGRVAGCIVENNPLGRKWQSCMKYAFHYFHANLYTIVGSDDLISHSLLRHISQRHAKNLENSNNNGADEFLPAMYCAMEWLVIHCNSNASLVPQIIKCNYEHDSAFQPLGAGRFYTRAFIEECDGLIFESDLERLLDDRGFFETKDRRKSLEYFTINDGPIISVKGSWSQMNKISDFLDSPTLNLEEYSFRGRELMREHLSNQAFSYLFKNIPLNQQLTFAR